MRFLTKLQFKHHYLVECNFSNRIQGYDSITKTHKNKLPTYSDTDEIIFLQSK